MVGEGLQGVTDTLAAHLNSQMGVVGTPRGSNLHHGTEDSITGPVPAVEGKHLGYNTDCCMMERH
jgi:hypothetical protein